MENKDSKPTSNYNKSDPDEKEIDYSDHPSEYIRNLYRDEKQTLKEIEDKKKEACLKCQVPLQEILSRLHKLIDKLEKVQRSNPEQVFFSNEQFCQIMCISKRTAQNWRNAGIIKYSSIRNKYYYRLSEILYILDKFQN